MKLNRASILTAIVALAMFAVSASATTFTSSTAQTLTVFDATANGADYNGGNLYDTIGIFNDAGSSAPFSVQVVDSRGNSRYLAGREATLPAGQGAGFSWPGHSIVQVMVIFTGSGTWTGYVCPIK